MDVFYQGILTFHYTYSLVVEVITPILDDTVTDYAGNRQAFALSARNSTAQAGMIMIIVLSPAIYNIRSSFIDCGAFMLGFISLGFCLCLIIVYYDSKGKPKVIIN